MVYLLKNFQLLYKHIKLISDSFLFDCFDGPSESRDLVDAYTNRAEASAAYHHGVQFIDIMDGFGRGDKFVVSSQVGMAQATVSGWHESINSLMF